MKTAKVLAVMAAVGVALVSWNGLAQNTGGGGQGGGTQADRIAQLKAIAESLKARAHDKKGIWADRPLPVELPDDIKKMIEDARKAAKEFVTDQEELRKQLKDATEQEREALREQMKESWTAFREAQRDRIQEIKQRLTELKQEFKDNHDRLIDAAKEQNGKGRGR